MKYALIDADIVAFKVASLCEEVSAFGGETVVTDVPKAHQMVDELIAEYCEATGCDRVMICLTDSKNFRKDVDPTYKTNRKDHYKPLLLGPLKEYMSTEYQSFTRPGLEADDVMGILATGPYLKGDKVIISEDKDMRTIPAAVYNPRKPDLGILYIDELDADRFHMWQTVCGDPTDGYTGCRGAGPKAAEEIIGADREELWDMVVDIYEGKNQTEADAINQARMARILRSCDWNNREKLVKLWHPGLLWNQ